MPDDCVLEFSPVLFPDWYYNLQSIALAPHLLQANARQLRKSTMRPPFKWQCWQERLFLKPYFVEPASVADALRSTHATLQQAAQHRDAKGKFEHYNTYALMTNALGHAAYLEKIHNVLEDTHRRQGKSFKYRRRFVDVHEAGDIVELPWELLDSSWANVPAWQKQECGAAGQTQAGAYIEVSYNGSGPHSRDPAEIFFAYVADLQYVLKAALRRRE